MDMQPDAIEALLERVRFFRLLQPGDRQALATRFEMRRVPAGACLFNLGDPGEEMYVLCDGTVDVDTHDKFGKKVSLATIAQGGILGELSLIDEGPRNATATAREDCALLVVRRADLLDLVRRNPEAALDLMGMLTERIRDTHDRLRRLAARNANEAIETRQSRLERITDIVAGWFGSLPFLVVHALVFALWIGWNEVIHPFDPYPYGLLTMAVSLEAILLSIMVLLTQNRQAARDRIRSDVEYEVNVTAGLQIAELHGKIDTLHAEVLGRLARLERAATRGLPRRSGDS